MSKVSAAALNAFYQGYLLKADVANLVSQAQASNVCTHGVSGQSCDPAAPKAGLAARSPWRREPGNRFSPR